jgi:hypothetical protein
LVRHAFLFPTPIHTFAQPVPPISIDAGNDKDYRARQIEPESPVTLRLSLAKRFRLTAVALPD